MLLAEEIMQAVVSVLDTALAATVDRGRVDPLPDNLLPAVGVFQGADVPSESQTLDFIDMELEVRTEVAASAVATQIETELNELRRQVYLAMMAEDALNLDYVIDVLPLGADEPSLDGETERVIGSMVVNWVVLYRHQRRDAGLAP